MLFSAGRGLDWCNQLPMDKKLDNSFRTNKVLTPANDTFSRWHCMHLKGNPIGSGVWRRIFVLEKHNIGTVEGHETSARPCRGMDIRMSAVVSICTSRVSSPPENLRRQENLLHSITVQDRMMQCNLRRHVLVSACNATPRDHFMPINVTEENGSAGGKDFFALQTAT